jgi:hypothetical protein
MTESETIEPRKWRKVDWRAGDTITIILTEQDAICLNYDHGHLVDLDDLSKIVDFDAACIKERA